MPDWSTIEAAFCKMMFDTYYHRAFASERCPWTRFAAAIVLSARRIPDKQAVLDWYAAAKGNAETRKVAITDAARSAAKRAGRRVAETLVDDDADDEAIT